MLTIVLMLFSSAFIILHSSFVILQHVRHAVA